MRSTAAHAATLTPEPGPFSRELRRLAAPAFTAPALALTALHRLVAPAISAPAISALAISALALTSLACGPVDLPPPALPPDLTPLTPQAPAPASTSASPAGATDAELAFKSMLQRVSSTRGLEIRGEVRHRTLDRATIAGMLREKAERELPTDVLAKETEALVAMGLIEPSYDATSGMLAMIGTSIAGFYEPADKTMYLVSDLEPAERDETLAHELVHALQDQHYDLGPMFKYEPGTDDRMGAGHAVAEGDATSAMFDVSRGDVMAVDESRFALAARASMETLAPDVPHALRASLISPYIDGYVFVQQLRRRGGFAAVDAAWRALPTTTEQLLHLDKYDAKEPAIELDHPSLAALDRPTDKRSFAEHYTQVLGEQGLRIVLEAWTTRDVAARAAAGWGGDRYVLARGDGTAAGETALAWQLRFDTEADAKEMAAVLSAQAHGECVLRPDVGPFAWMRHKRDVALTFGPYSRSGPKTHATGTCKEARAWLTTLLTPPKPPKKPK